MSEKYNPPIVGTTCPALTEENYEYHLSDDARGFNICSITNSRCHGRIIGDFEDESSRFFSRARCAIDLEAIKTCPLYGCSANTIEMVITDRHNNELDKKLANLKKGTK